MKNYETAGSKIIIVNEKNPTVPLIHNEDYTMLVRITSKTMISDKLICTGYKVWDTSPIPHSFTFRVKYLTQQTNEPFLDAVTVGEEIIVHRVGEYAGLGADGYELHTSDISKVSWVAFIPPAIDADVFAVVAWNVQGAVDFSQGEIISFDSETGEANRTGLKVWIDYSRNPPHLNSVGDTTIYSLKFVLPDETRGNETLDLYTVDKTVRSDESLKPYIVQGYRPSSERLVIKFMENEIPFWENIPIYTTIAGVQKENILTAEIDYDWIGETDMFKYARITSTFPLMVAPVNPIMAKPQLNLYMDAYLTTGETYNGTGEPPVDQSISLYRGR